jgi:hypothetical protein
MILHRYTKYLHKPTISAFHDGYRFGCKTPAKIPEAASNDVKATLRIHLTEEKHKTYRAQHFNAGTSSYQAQKPGR